MTPIWEIEVDGNQEEFQNFCEEFMSENIVVLRRWKSNNIFVTCRIDMDPYKPIDSTGSMPSFVDQIRCERKFSNIQVREQ